MKYINNILVLIFISIQIGICQNENIGYSKVITTIDFFNNTSDTIVRIHNFDPNGIEFERFSKNISFPLKIDTIRISDQEINFVSTWEDNSKSIEKTIQTVDKLERIGFDKNGEDTIFYSLFYLSKEKLPINGIITSHGLTTKFFINEIFSLDEIREIQNNIQLESEFINFCGDIHCINKRFLTITDLLETRNKVEIYLNKKLKPKNIIVHRWNNFHQIIFKNKYFYKYKSDNLIEIKNFDESGDLEMIRKIEYKNK